MSSTTVRDDTSGAEGSGRRRAWRYRAMGVLNAIPRFVLRSPLHGPMSGGFLLLTVRGRASGRCYSIPVAWQEHDGALLIGTDRPWRKNLRSGDGIDVWFRGRQRRAAVEVVTDLPDVQRLFDVIIPRNPVLARFLSLRLDPDGSVNREDLRRAVVRGVAVIRLTLE